MRFNLIEGNKDFDYKRFEEIYMDTSKTRKEWIESVPDLTTSIWSRLARDVFKETGFSRNLHIAGKKLDPDKYGASRQKDVADKYIYSNKLSENYFLYKTISSEKRYFGCLKNLALARVIRDELEECNWSDECIAKLRKKYKIRGKGDKR